MPNGLTPHRAYWIIAPVAIALIGGGLSTWRDGGTFRYSRFGQKVSFSRDIRPILNQNCVVCHGGVRRKFGFIDYATGSEGGIQVHSSLLNIVLHD